MELECLDIEGEDLKKQKTAEASKGSTHASTNSQNTNEVEQEKNNFNTEHDNSTQG